MNSEALGSPGTTLVISMVLLPRCGSVTFTSTARFSSVENQVSRSTVMAWALPTLPAGITSGRPRARIAKTPFFT